MVVRNNIPQSAIVLESIVAVLIFSVAILTYLKYRQRRRLSTLYLAISILSYAFGVVASVSGKYYQFFLPQSQDNQVYSGFTINFAYCFVAFGNIFLYSFTENVFLSDNNYRKYIFGGINGILIGLIIDTNSLSEEAYLDILPFVGLFIITSYIIYAVLVINCFKEFRITDSRVSKVGFLFIGLFGFFLAMIFTFFIVDLIKFEITGMDYNIEYYLAWSSAAIACIFGYLGYIMPAWLRVRLQPKEE